MSVRANLRKFVRHVRTHGIAHAVRLSSAYLCSGKSQQPTDIVAAAKNLNALYCAPFGDVADLATLGNDETRMQWIIPSFGFGSGGHTTIFRFVNNLAAMGYPQRIVILGPHAFQSAAIAKKAMTDWYFPVDAEVALGQEGVVASDVLIATGHQTAHTVAAYRAARHRLYFVQDFEPSFFPASSMSYWAESTYTLGLTGVTAGGWLAQKLGQDFGMKTHAISFGVDHSIYHPLGRTPRVGKKTIVFYARHVTPRRLVELGLAALLRLHEVRDDFKVIVVGGSLDVDALPFEVENLGEVPEAALGDVFRRSDVGLVLSGTNLSLMPLELAACKCAVVMNDNPNARWLLDEKSAVFARSDPAGLAYALSSALEDTSEARARVAAAYMVARRADWMDEARDMAAFIETLDVDTSIIQTHAASCAAA
ncbi:MAG: glycosyltransferase family 4 protein [Celeribacter marinus]